jgi:RimJ/RimL family protein N-acetyltransferase
MSEFPSDGPGAHPVLDLVDPAGVVRAWLWWWWPEREDESDELPAPEELRLRDGTAVWIRPILPSDRELHAANYDRLSEESKYHRFLTPIPHLSEEMLDRLVDDVDGVDHVAYYVFADSEDLSTSVLPIAIGRIKRDPEHADAADVAVTVQDPWHGRGVATALLPILVARRPAGVTHILTLVASDNVASLAMLKRLGAATMQPDGAGAIQVRIELPERPDGEQRRGTRSAGKPAHAAERSLPALPALPPEPSAVGTGPALGAVAGVATAAEGAVAAVVRAGQAVLAPWQVALRDRDQDLPWFLPGAGPWPGGRPWPLARRWR